MSAVTITITDSAVNDKVVDIKWEVDGDDNASPAKSLAAYILEHLQTIRDSAPVTDVEEKA